MRRISDFMGPAGALAMALALAGCGTVGDLFSGEANLLPRPTNPFKMSRFRVFRGPKNPNVTHPVTAADLVDAAGYCSAVATETTVAATAAPAPALPPPPTPAPMAPPPSDGPMVLTPGAVSATPSPASAPVVASNDPAVATAPPDTPAAPTVPLVAGGIALNMTECEVVRRAGHPERLDVGTDVHGERNVVMTYIHGERPGIYHFVAGRLKEIERAPEPPPPPKKKKKRPRRRA
jgi:hypothetical protein